MKGFRKIKKAVSILMIMTICGCCMACGSKDTENGSSSASIEGELTDIMTEIYAGVNVDAETKEAMQGYVSQEINADNEEYILGVTGVPYTEGICSMPAMSSIAYQCVLLRVNLEDVESVKATLQENADVNKWVCVTAETVLVENVGDLVLFIMSSEDVAYAVSSSFQSLK